MVSVYTLQGDLIATGASVAAVVMANKGSMRYANLCNQNFSGLNLSGVDFTGAALDNCNLIGANCSGCDFTEASMGGVQADSTTSFYLARGVNIEPGYPSF